MDYSKKFLIIFSLQFKNVSRKTVNEIFFNKFNESPKSISELIGILRNLKIEISEYEIYNAKLKTDKIMTIIEKDNINYILVDEECYPKLLRDIPNNPRFIFVKGDISSVTDKKCVAIVGTRNPTKHGFKIAKRLGEVYANKGFCVVSGLALGCDTYAHIGAIGTKLKGATAAIFGTAINKIYPKENILLADQILANGGCLISEYYPDERVYRGSFVERNRIQSGISKGIIVVETDIAGGTMHTVKFAREQRRLIAAYPNKYPEVRQAQGTNNLLKDKEILNLSDSAAIDMFEFKMNTCSL